MSWASEPGSCDHLIWETSPLVIVLLVS